MNITVEEFVNLFTDPSAQKVNIYGLESEKLLFSGFLDDMPSNLQDMEICSIDIIDPNYGNSRPTINVEA